MKHTLPLVLLLIFSSTVAQGAKEANSPKLTDILKSESSPQPEPSQEATQKKETGPHDKYNRISPRESFQGLSDALENRDYELALNYMDLRKLPSHIKGRDIKLSRELKIILDRSPWVDPDTLSTDNSGLNNDGLPSYRDLLTSLETPARDVDIYMQRVPGDNGIFIWKLSNRSVANIPMLYEHYGYGEIGDKLSKAFPEYSFLGLVVWQWILLFGIALAAFVIAWVITRTIDFILRVRKVNGYEQLQKFLAGPVRFLILIMIARAMFDSIAPSTLARAIFEAKTAPTIAIAWLLMGLIELAFGRLAERLKNAGNEQAIMLLRPATSLLKVIVILIALMSWLDNLGFSVTTLLAGLGVGGIAIGLAAQKSIENLIGAITMYVAQPVRIGDFCRAGKTIGVIEEIGLRSTMIRTLDRTLVAIPNATFANMDIENITQRDKILYRRTIKLRNDSTPDQVRSVLENVRNLFKEHEEVNPEPARIRFTEYGEYSLNLEAFAYINTNDFNKYLGIVEDLNLRIMDIIEAAGTRLAVPARVMVNK